MTRRPLSPVRATATLACASALFSCFAPAAALAAGDFPITSQQRATAQQIAQSGVPLSELAANAPDAYTVRPGDTLWDISKLFLKSPWRWPELWGMNLEQIRNPHLIYPGQLLVLEKSDGRARLRLGQQLSGNDTGTVRLSPHVRSEPVGDGAIGAVPLHLIAPFLNEAVVFNRDELAAAPRIVAAPEGRVMMSRGDIAYVRGDLGGKLDFRVFRQAKPLADPTTHEVLGFEAPYLGTAQFVRAGSAPEVKPAVPATFTLTSVREEVGVGDRLAPVPPRDFSSYAPHSPEKPIAGQIISIYGQGLYAGQNQIVSLNRGAKDGMERGVVLALWRKGAQIDDRSSGKRETVQLPDERHGLLFVFRVFDRVSYALILSVQEPVNAGDRFTQP